MRLLKTPKKLPTAFTSKLSVFEISKDKIVSNKDIVKNTTLKKPLVRKSKGIIDAKPGV